MIVYLIIFLISIIDAVLTVRWIDLYQAQELNPIMSWLLQFGYGWFILVKLSLTGFGLSVLYWFRHHRLARIGTHLCLFAYLMVMLTHLRGFWIYS